MFKTCIYETEDQAHKAITEDLRVIKEKTKKWITHREVEISSFDESEIKDKAIEGAKKILKEDNEPSRKVKMMKAYNDVNINIDVSKKESGYTKEDKKNFFEKFEALKFIESHRGEHNGERYEVTQKNEERTWAIERNSPSTREALAFGVFFLDSSNINDDIYRCIMDNDIQIIKIKNDRVTLFKEAGE